MHLWVVGLAFVAGPVAMLVDDAIPIFHRSKKTCAEKVGAHISEQQRMCAGRSSIQTDTYQTDGCTRPFQ